MCIFRYLCSNCNDNLGMFLKLKFMSVDVLAEAKQQVSLAGSYPFFIHCRLQTVKGRRWLVRRPSDASTQVKVD